MTFVRDHAGIGRGERDGPVGRGVGGGVVPRARSCTVASRRAVLAERGSSAAARARRERAVPAAQARSVHRGRAQQVDVVGRELEAVLVLPRAPRSLSIGFTLRIEVAERQVALRSFGAEAGGRAPPRAGPARPAPGGDGVEVAVSAGAGELRPGRREGGVERDRPLVEADRPPQARRDRSLPSACDAASPFRNASYAARFSVGLAASSRRALSPSATPSASATLVAMSACTWNTSVSAASNCCPSGCGPPGPGARPPARASPAPGSCRPAFSHRTVAVSR